MNTFFKMDIVSYGVVVVCIAVCGAVAAFVVYVFLLRSLSVVLMTRLNVHRRRRDSVVRVLNGIMALLCVGLYLAFMIPMVRVQLANMSPVQNKVVEVVSDKCSKSDCGYKKCQNDRPGKVHLLQDLSSTDLQIRYKALDTACRYMYGLDHELLELDKSVLTLIEQLTKSDDVLERYLANKAWNYYCRE
jgi:hypothetical protein